MAANVIMPALGLAQQTGKVLRWLKSEGEAISQGDPLIEIETDKITVELEAPASGILTNVTAAAGDTVPVGQVIAMIRAPGELLIEPPATLSGSPAGRTTGQATPEAAAPVSPPKTLTSSAPPVRPQASPKARRLARESGIDLAALSGTGPGGAVLAGDVQGGGMEGQSLPVPTAWRVMAERTTQSWTSVPHFFLLREVNATQLIRAREHYQQRPNTEVTYTDLLVKLVAASLRDHPRLNATWTNGRIMLNAEINIGLAVAVDAGLVVPVISGADRLRVREIATQRKELVHRAQAGTLRPEDIRGGTFTVSNLGMYGVDAFTAVLNPPQAAILAVGRITDRVVAVEGRPSVQPMMTLTLACDHRVADGARGAQFLEHVAKAVEQPSADES